MQMPGIQILVSGPCFLPDTFRPAFFKDEAAVFEDLVLQQWFGLVENDQINIDSQLVGKVGLNFNALPAGDVLRADHSQVQITLLFLPPPSSGPKEVGRLNAGVSGYGLSDGFLELSVHGCVFFGVVVT